VQFSLLASRQRANLFHGFIGELQDLAGFLKKDFSLSREDDAARTTFEKVNADFVFQILDSPTQRRLRDAQERRRFREIQRFSNS
jgi:hypothetical protein